MPSTFTIKLKSLLLVAARQHLGNFNMAVLMRFVLPSLQKMKKSIVFAFQFPYRRWRWFLLGLLTALLILWPLPNLAQTPPSRSVQNAPVVLDGRVVFEVGAAGSYSAQKRAEIISNLLAEVRKAEQIEVELGQESGATVIRANDEILLTVTERDAENLQVQGERWVKTVEAALQRSQEERSPAYVRQQVLAMAGIVLASIVLFVLLQWGEKWLVLKLSRGLGQPSSPLYGWEQPVKAIVRIVLVAVDVGFCLFVLFLLSDRLPQTRHWRYQLQGLFFNPLIPLGENNAKSLFELLLLVGTSLGLWFGIRLVAGLLQSRIRTRIGTERIPDFVVQLVQYSLTLLGLLILLPMWGFNLGSLAIFASVLGVGIGFGTQNIANNFISGLIITLERPIKVGDFVDVDGLVGIVENIGARSTTICTLDRVTIVVPNSRFLETEVINRSYGNPVSRLRIPIGVAYGSKVEAVKAALLEAATSHPEVLLRPQPQVWFQEFGDSSLNFELHVWTGEPKNQPRIKSDLNYRIEESLRRYDIEVPFPQRDLNLRSPYLETLIKALIGQYNPDLLQEEAAKIETADGEDNPQPNPTLAVQPPTEPTAAKFRHKNHWRAIDIEKVAARMRGEGGVKIKDRRYRLNVYPSCFVGSEAVSWLVECYGCTRDEAVALGKRLGDRGIIHHVADEHPFQDKYLFYRFYADETANR